jgi:hypothetical protein
MSHTPSYLHSVDIFYQKLRTCEIAARYCDSVHRFCFTAFHVHCFCSILRRDSGNVILRHVTSVKISSQILGNICRSWYLHTIEIHAVNSIIMLCQSCTLFRVGEGQNSVHSVERKRFESQFGPDSTFWLSLTENL